MTLLNRLPFFPLYYNGKTKFSPIHSLDMAEIISTIIENKKKKMHINLEHQEIGETVS